MTAPQEKFMAIKISQLFIAAITPVLFGTAFAQTPAAAAFSTPTSASTPPPASTFAAANLTPLGIRSLAANCSACHGTNGNSVGGAFGGLAGLDKDYFVNQMKLFKEGKREATLMHQISKGYSDAEITAMAGFFSVQKK
jgi:sulfide dehydrogenase cytochrome subunit